MTQIPSQPAYPAYNVPPPPPIAPWSGSAIAGFVISFFGCSLIGGLVGLILGIVGILDCRGGRRRGMGLAIAALPIALLSTAFTVVILLVFVGVGKQFVEAGRKVIPAIQSADKLEAAGVIRDFTTDEFNDEVSKEALAEWLKTVEAKHGKLTGLKLHEQRPMMPSNDDFLHLNFEGKFVNGNTDVTIVMSIMPFRIIDFEIADIESPRKSKGESK